MVITLFLMIRILFLSEFYPFRPRDKLSQYVKYQGQIKDKGGHPYENEIEQVSIYCKPTKFFYRSIEMCPPRSPVFRNAAP